LNDESIAPDALDQEVNREWQDLKQMMNEVNDGLKQIYQAPPLPMPGTPYAPPYHINTTGQQPGVPNISIDASRFAVDGRLRVRYRNLSTNPGPEFAHQGDSGFDLRASEACTVEPGAFRLVDTGLQFEIPHGFELQVRPRSGNAAKYGLSVVNTPGTVDSHYRGNVKVILINFGPNPVVINVGDRIAQGVVCPVFGEGKLHLLQVEELGATQRGADGIGSTGAQ